MASFGENLRREREMRRITLEEISYATKISVHNLHALEAEDFSKLPGGIFNRSFVRAYAQYLGLDQEKILAEFQLVSPSADNFDLKHFNPSKPAASLESSRGRLFGWLFAAALLIAGFALYRYSHPFPATGRGTGNRDAAAPAARVPEPQAREASRASSMGSPARPSPETASSPRPGSHARAKTAPDSSLTAKSDLSDNAGSESVLAGDALVLQVAATERAWVAVDADGKPAFQRILSPHEFQTVKARGYFDFITGNAQGVILTLNGKTLDPLGAHGEVKKIHLTRDDLKNSNP